MSMSIFLGPRHPLPAEHVHFFSIRKGKIGIEEIMFEKPPVGSSGVEQMSVETAKPHGQKG